MKRPPNMSLICVHAETDEAHGDCVKENCGCVCHNEPPIAEKSYIHERIHMH